MAKETEKNVLHEDVLQKGLSAQQSIFLEVMNHIDNMVYVIDQKTHAIKFINNKLREKLGGYQDDQTCFGFLYQNEQSCERCPIISLQNAQGSASAEIYNPISKEWSVSSCAPIQWIDGSDAFLMTISDITKEKRQEILVEKMAYYDKLLSIPNRDMFAKMFDELFLDDGRKVGAILIMDINDFKFFNDTFGHKLGDMLLQKVVESLHKLPIRGEVFRVGSDEFAVLLPDYDRDAARAVADSIIDIFNRPFSINGIDYTCFISIGMVLYPDHVLGKEDLMIALDYTMVEAKKRQLNQLLVFDNDIKEKLKRKGRIIDALKSAVKHKRFEVYYQPILSVSNSQFTKAEALLRLYDKELGNIPPDEFIPVAEETGNIMEMGLMVIEQACQTIVELLEENIKIDSVEVNISVVQFMNENFVTSVKEVLSRYNIPLNYLGFEITESVLISSFDLVKSIMTQFNGIGIHFSLDDFGTGYSSISYLTKLPLSVIKLDRAFIKNIADSRDNQIIVKSIVEMTRKLGFEVVAEGVEDLDQLEFLKTYRCNYIQGYLYSKPMPRKDFLRFMQEQHNRRHI